MIDLRKQVTEALEKYGTKAGALKRKLASPSAYANLDDKKNKLRNLVRGATGTPSRYTAGSQRQAERAYSDAASQVRRESTVI